MPTNTVARTGGVHKRATHKKTSHAPQSYNKNKQQQQHRSRAPIATKSQFKNNKVHKNDNELSEGSLFVTSLGGSDSDDSDSDDDDSSDAGKNAAEKHKNRKRAELLKKPVHPSWGVRLARAEREQVALNAFVQRQKRTKANDKQATPSLSLSQGHLLVTKTTQKLVNTKEEVAKEEDAMSSSETTTSEQNDDDDFFV